MMPYCVVGHAELPHHTMTVTETTTYETQPTEVTHSGDGWEETVTEYETVEVTVTILTCDSCSARIGPQDEPDPYVTLAVNPTRNSPTDGDERATSLSSPARSVERASYNPALSTRRELAEMASDIDNPYLRTLSHFHPEEIRGWDVNVEPHDDRIPQISAQEILVTTEDALEKAVERGVYPEFHRQPEPEDVSHLCETCAKDVNLGEHLTTEPYTGVAPGSSDERERETDDKNGLALSSSLVETGIKHVVTGSMILGVPSLLSLIIFGVNPVEPLINPSIVTDVVGVSSSPLTTMFLVTFMSGLVLLPFYGVISIVMGLVLIITTVLGEIGDRLL